ncbi:SMI1/KNR4 family protein [Streptomyces pactum]|uniref:SMI1/KNR4 family protein n=2 Tax=Streptomyces pactum TaxID=68249 RepID=A0ABS0NUJ0_9ACTN|nr:SMI1/KNR4 family protein [Streptomyces pactum]
MAETVLGQTFPGELAELLLRHDGSGYFDVIGVFQLLSVSAIVSNRQAATNLEVATQREGDTTGYFLREGYALWHPSDLPFASDSGGSLLILDTRPQATSSRVGKHDELGRTTFPADAMWESLNHLLDAVATAMETRTPLGRYTATAKDGRLTWQGQV